MGNTHVFFHRVPALATAALATFAVGFAVSAGITCSFVSVLPEENGYIEYTTPEGITIAGGPSSIGLNCDSNPPFSREGDGMWEISRTLWIVAVSSGGFATLLGWLLTTVMPPTNGNWKALSVLAALTAVIQVPVFLIFEAQPCIDYTCQLDTGCYLMIMSIVFWTTVTLLTQCLDPPLWAVELNAWRVGKEQGEQKSDLTTRWLRWKRHRGWVDRESEPTPPVESGTPEERIEDLLEDGSYYANSSNSRLLLKIQDGRRPGDDQKSVTTFGDLDEFVTLAEDDFRDMENLLGEPDFPDDEVDQDKTLLEETVPLEEHETAEIMIIHSHEDPPQYYTDPKAFPQNATPKGVLLLDGMDVVEATRTSMDENGAPTKLAAGIRALTNRIRCDTKRRGGKSYTAVDEGGSDGDDEDDDREVLYSPPMTPENNPAHSRPDGNTLESQALLNDWEKLHAAANAGILLPGLNHLDDDTTEDDPEPVFYSSEESQGVSLSSFGHRVESTSGALGVGLGTEDDETLSSMSDSSEDDQARRQRREEKKANLRGRNRHRRQRFSSANSVGSRASLLDITIDEETDVDLKEFESSDDDDVKKPPDTLLNTISSPERSRSVHEDDCDDDMSIDDAAFEPRAALSVGVVSEHGDGEETERSRDAEEIYQLIVERRVTPVTEGETSSSDGDYLRVLDPKSPLSAGYVPSGEENETQTDITSASNDVEDNNNIDDDNEGVKRCFRRCRSVSAHRRRQAGSHSTTRGKSASARLRPHRDEHMIKAGIHSTTVHVVSDDSSSSGKSSSSQVSRRAREARIQRLSDQKYRRARTLDPPRRRKTHDTDLAIDAILLDRSTGAEAGVEASANPTMTEHLQSSHKTSTGLDSSLTALVMDPSLDAILKLRREGAEYGPDEASL